MYDVNTQDVRRFFAYVWQHRLMPLQLDIYSRRTGNFAVVPVANKK